MSSGSICWCAVRSSKPTPNVRPCARVRERERAIDPHTHTYTHTYAPMYTLTHTLVRSPLMKVDAKCKTTRVRSPSLTHTHSRRGREQERERCTHVRTLARICVLSATHAHKHARICAQWAHSYIQARRGRSGWTMQHTATHWNMLQHTATLCNTRQHSATRCNSVALIRTVAEDSSTSPR